MTRLTKIFLGISIVFSLIFIVGFFLPNNFKAEQSLLINKAHGQIYPYLNELREWEKWSFISKKDDPTLHITYSQPSSGEGANQRWKGDHLEDGILKIKESYPLEGIRYEMRIQNGEIKINGNIRFVPQTETATRVDWICEGKLGDNPLFRYFGLLFDDMLEADMAKSLNKLKRVAEKESLP